VDKRVGCGAGYYPRVDRGGWRRLPLLLLLLLLLVLFDRFEEKGLKN